MKYRIRFEANGAYWCLQTSVLGLIWDTAVEHVPSLEGPSVKLLKFETFDQAQEYVKSVGLDKAYPNFTSSPELPQRGLSPRECLPRKALVAEPLRAETLMTTDDLKGLVGGER